MFTTSRLLPVAVLSALVLGACAAQPGSDPAATPATDTAQASDQMTPEIELPDGATDPSQFEEPQIESIAFDVNTIVPDGTVSADGKVTKDITKWTLPTDPYSGLTTEQLLAGEQAFVQRCLKGKGIEQSFTPVKFNIHPEFPDYAPHADRAIFNEQVAARQGYGIGRVSDGREVPFLDVMQSIFAGENQDDIAPWVACQEEFSKQYDWQQKYVVPNDNWQLPKEEAFAKEPLYAVNHYDVGVTTPEREQAMANWKACMEPALPGEVPEYPNLMPPFAKSEAWAQLDAATGQPKGVTQDQIDLAVKDAQCREQSGYTRAVYDSLWGLLQQYVKDHQAALDERAKTIEAEVAEVARLQAEAP